MNLCTNSYHAMRPAGGTLSVKVATVDVEPELASTVDGLRPGPFVRLTVADTGCGMNEALRSRIFEPYFTTKGLGEGTGLGLSVVRGIVVNSGGAVSVKSAAGAGSTFTVFIPAHRDEEERPAADATGMPRGGESVLFVDDEPSLARLGRKILENLGYSVKETTSSVEALRMFRADPEGFDLVVSDQTMPEYTGVDLAGRFMEIRPDVPFVLCTGYSDIVDEKGAKSLGVRKFLLKPLDRGGLARAVREVLDGEAPS